MAAQEFDILRRQICARMNAQPLHFLLGLGANAVEAPDRQPGDKIRAFSRANDAHAIGFVLIARQLGEELVVRNACARCQLCLGADFLPDQLRNAGCAANAQPVFGHIEIGLIEAQRFHQRRVMIEDGPDLPAGFLVGIKPVFHENEIGAQPFGGDGWHGAFDAEFARFVTRRCHNTAPARTAHRHRLPTQFGMIALFHAGKEGIHIDMDDLAQAPFNGLVGVRIGLNQALSLRSFILIACTVSHNCENRHFRGAKKGFRLPPIGTYEPINDIVFMLKSDLSPGERSNAAPPHQHAPARVMGETELIWLMAMLMALQAFGIDAILPALDDVALALGVPGNERQFVVGIYLLTAGLGALVPGALADRFGRRPIVLASIGVYIVLSLASALVTSFEALLAVRAAQGFFGAGIVALPPAIIRDRVGGDKMARMMSLIFVIFLMVPAIAPSIGQVVLLVADWRAIFALMAVQGVLVGAWVYFRLPESLAPEDRVPIRPRTIAANMGRALSLRSVTGYVFGSALVFGALFGFINSSQQLVTDGFGAGDVFPIVFGICAGSMAFASWSNSRIVERFGARRVSHTAVLAFIAVASVQVFFAFQPEESLYVFVPLMAVNMALLGFIGSNFGSIAMNPFFAIAGAASSAHSAVRLSMASLLGAAIGYAFDGTARPLALSLLAAGIGCLVLVLVSEKGKLFGPPEAPMRLGTTPQAAE